ncbi:ubiquitin-like-specific protease 1D [Solanum pennellii]|uniref:Ubiquitin-like-specific protease 1D n=1 Tax=Solanum pennellii TaxID=28526 RepID=A0ABM1FZF6_SOLPN|nr:ubiquitin-like-specific protease 1D [Solanum pennellii]
MSKRERGVKMKSTNNPLLHNPSESSAPGIVNHQQVDIHVPANQKLKGIHVPGETRNLYQNCSLSKNVPRLQKSKEGLQNSVTDQERNHTELASWSQFRSRSRPSTQKSKVTADTTHSEVIPQQASCFSQSKPQSHSQKRTKSKITANTTDSEVIPQQASCFLQSKPRLHPRKRTKNKITANTTDSEAIQQQASCCSQIKPRPHSRKRSKSRITADSTDSEVIPLRASRCHGQSRRNNSQKGLGSSKFELYLESIWKLHPEDRRNTFTYLDSLWFSLYSERSHKAKVLNWIAKKKIFSKEYVFVPIVLWGHWSLLIFCHLGESLQSKERSPCMLLLDSLHMANPERFDPGIRKFVIDLFKAEQRPETKDQIMKIPLMIPKVPQQQNDEDCGNFVLYYINLFLESAPENFSISKGYPYFMTEDWFTPERLECFLQKVQSASGSSSDSDECLLDDGDVVCIDP